MAKTKRQTAIEKIKELHRSAWDIDGSKIVEHGRGVVAIVPLVDAGGVFDRMENLALLRSAPELLKASEQLLAIVVNAIMHGMPITDSVADARNLAVFHIAKARGVSQ